MRIMSNLPEPFKDVMITYIKTISSGVFGLIKTKEKVTEKGFYSDLFNHFAIPPGWRKFNGMLLPHGFGGTNLKEEEIIKWEYINE